MIFSAVLLTCVGAAHVTHVGAVMVGVTVGIFGRKTRTADDVPPDAWNISPIRHRTSSWFLRWIRRTWILVL